MRYGWGSGASGAAGNNAAYRLVPVRVVAEECGMELAEDLADDCASGVRSTGFVAVLECCFSGVAAPDSDMILPGRVRLGSYASPGRSVVTGADVGSRLCDLGCVLADCRGGFGFAGWAGVALVSWVGCWGVVAGGRACREVVDGCAAGWARRGELSRVVVFGSELGSGRPVLVGVGVGVDVRADGLGTGVELPDVVDGVLGDGVPDGGVVGGGLSLVDGVCSVKACPVSAAGAVAVGGCAAWIGGVGVGVDVWMDGPGPGVEVPGAAGGAARDGVPGAGAAGVEPVVVVMSGAAAAGADEEPWLGAAAGPRPVAAALRPAVGPGVGPAVGGSFAISWSCSRTSASRPSPGRTSGSAERTREMFRTASAVRPSCNAARARSSPSLAAVAASIERACSV
ncbi:hypothetical protein [Pseudonocardia asaccharolytica]|uniref:Uncharacterized protein n=1 Tax=Pseudonocardia asaccharolytica DSM 44247 = NBRC 16224 TaxID=1123024 RepID=A0A511D0I5_9PSEU|nr:hypothetical protein [Pseudonocardia asaccharolytica]GEL18291.1 hypothetical protein PA7_21280 [Pseudonocardia asaccharolytica DSM 44247 = NBRC 16224]